MLSTFIPASFASRYKDHYFACIANKGSHCCVMQFLSFNLCAMHFICFFFQNSFSTYNPNFKHNYACFICQSLHKSLVRMHSLKCTWPCYTTFLFLLHCIFSKVFYSRSACNKHFNNNLYLFYLWPLQQFIYYCVLLHCILRTMHYILFFSNV